MCFGFHPGPPPQPDSDTEAQLQQGQAEAALQSLQRALRTGAAQAQQAS